MAGQRPTSAPPFSFLHHRGLFIDDAASGVASIANGVLLADGVGGAADGAHRFVATTWRAVNPGFANCTVTFSDGGKAVARLVRYDPGRPVAILAVDAAAVALRPGVGLDADPAAAGLQVGDPLLGVGLAEDAPTIETPADAWSTYVGYAYDLRAPLPRAEGAASPLRNVRALVARSLITRPWLAPGAGLFDVGGNLVGLDIEGDLTTAGVGGKKAETHTLPAVYVRDAVRDAALELGGGVRPRRGDVGAALTLVRDGERGREGGSICPRLLPHPPTTTLFRSRSAWRSSITPWTPRPRGPQPPPPRRPRTALAPRPRLSRWWGWTWRVRVRGCWRREMFCWPSTAARRSATTCARSTFS